MNFQAAHGICAKAYCLCVISQIAHKFLHVSSGSLVAWERSEEAQIILTSQREGGIKKHLLQHLPFLSAPSLNPQILRSSMHGSIPLHLQV